VSCCGRESRFGQWLRLDQEKNPRLTQSLGPAWFAQRPGPTFVTESVGFGSGSVDWFQSLPSLARALVCLWVSGILVALRTSTGGTNEKVQGLLE
jgi:hypothetical protein